MQLTKYPEGSFRQLCALAFPLMLSSFSVMSMIFADRWLLAHYSVEAHNAAVTASALGWVFIFTWVVLVNIVEVFVAQYNGAGLQHRMGEPVWQMIWLSLGSFFFFIPLAFFGADWLYGISSESRLEHDFFSIMMLFGPFYPLGASLCGFFIGQGKTRLVTIVVILGSLLNIALDMILIFGVEGWVPSLGVKGAAIATSTATIFQSIVLGTVFFSRKHREQHGTLKYALRLNKMWECVKIGLPTAVFCFCENLAFAVYYIMMKGMGMEYITIAGICQSVLIFFLFFAEGINKATATIVGNMIGAGRSMLVSKVMMAGFKLNFLCFAIILIAFLCGSSFIIHEFLPQADPSFVEEIRETLETCLLIMTVYLLLEGVRSQLTGVLTAAGDTFFIFVTGTTVIWILMVLPIYVMVIHYQASMVVASSITVVYGVVASIFYYWRIRTGKWRSIVISSDMKTEFRIQNI